MLLAARAVQGNRCCPGGAVGALLAHHRVRSGVRAGPSHRPLHHGVGRRRRHRTCGRGAPHPTRLVAMGDVRERPHRGDHLASRPDRHRRDRAPPRTLRPGRGAQLHPRGHGDRVRPGGGRDQWVDEPRYRLGASPSGWFCSASSSTRSGGWRSRSCRSGCSRTALGARPTPAGPCSTPASTASSTSWLSSCRTSRATHRCAPGSPSSPCPCRSSSRRSSPAGYSSGASPGRR